MLPVKMFRVAGRYTKQLIDVDFRLSLGMGRFWLESTNMYKLQRQTRTQTGLATRNRYEKRGGTKRERVQRDDASGFFSPRFSLCQHPVDH